jgi:predicted benzoate:H+ symporter BenE
VISLTPETMGMSLITVLRFLILIVAVLALMEAVLYVLFHRRPKNALQGVAILALTVVLVYGFARYVRPAESLDTAKKAGIGLALLLGDLASTGPLVVLTQADWVWPTCCWLLR